MGINQNWHEIVEEEELIARIVIEQQLRESLAAQMTVNDSTAMTADGNAGVSSAGVGAAGAGGVPPDSFFNPPPPTAPPAPTFISTGVGGVFNQITNGSGDADGLVRMYASYNATGPWQKVGADFSFSSPAIWYQFTFGPYNWAYVTEIGNGTNYVGESPPSNIVGKYGEIPDP